MRTILLLLLSLAIASGQQITVKKVSDLTAATTAADAEIIVLADPTGVSSPKKITFANFRASLAPSFASASLITGTGTLNIGTGGTLGTAAYTNANAYQSANATLAALAANSGTVNLSGLSLTLPSGFVTTTGSQTLTNKTYSGGSITGTISGVNSTGVIDNVSINPTTRRDVYGSYIYSANGADVATNMSIGGQLAVSGAVYGSSFNGAHIGDGSGLTNIPGGTVWTDVSGNTSVTASKAHGYFINTFNVGTTVYVAFEAVGPSVGDTVEIWDSGSSWGSYPVNVDTSPTGYSMYPSGVTSQQFTSSNFRLRFIFNGNSWVTDAHTTNQ